MDNLPLSSGHAAWVRSGVVRWADVQYTRISKWVALDLVDTHRLVTHILQNKGLPFQDKGLRFRLEGSNLTLHLDKGYLQGTNTQGTIITLTPLHPDNLPLSDSLREHIDEALKPRGLTP